jgi:hypothetical protein
VRRVRVSRGAGVMGVRVWRVGGTAQRSGACVTLGATATTHVQSASHTQHARTPSHVAGTHALTHSFAHSLTHYFTHARTHALHARARARTHALTEPQAAVSAAALCRLACEHDTRALASGGGDNNSSGRQAGQRRWARGAAAAAGRVRARVCVCMCARMWHVCVPRARTRPATAATAPPRARTRALAPPRRTRPHTPHLGARVHLVQHHVLELLVVHGAHEDVRFQGLACCVDGVRVHVHVHVHVQACTRRVCKWV